MDSVNVRIFFLCVKNLKITSINKTIIIELSNLTIQRPVLKQVNLPDFQVHYIRHQSL